MAWDEWEQLKAEAADRHTARMQLNQLPADQGGDTPTGGAKTGATGGSGTLKHSGGPWTRAAGAAEDLRISTESTKKHLQSGHTGVSKGAEGLASVEVLTTVRTSGEDSGERVGEGSRPTPETAEQ